MMFNARSFIAALIVGIGCGWIALGGQREVFALGKAASVGLVSGYIVFISFAGWFSIQRAMRRCDLLEDAFAERTVQLPPLRQLEKSATRRGNLPGVAERLSQQFGARLSDEVTFSRWVASVSVYIGLAGTLIGLTCAVFGLRNLDTDPEILKNQILSVVSGFGGSFACALCGIVATVLLSNKLSQFDEQVEGLEDMAEIHISEIVFRDVASGDDRLADLVGQAVSQSLERVAEVWTTFTLTGEKFETAGETIRSAAKSIDLAANRLSRQTETTNEITKELSFISTDASETAALCAKAGENLHAVVVQLLPAFKALMAGMEALDVTISRTAPTIESAQSLGKTIDLAQEVVNNLESRVAGIGGSVREEVKLASNAIVEYHQNVLQEGINPPLASLARSMDLLVLMIDKAEQLLQNIPISIPAQRLVSDLEAAGVAHLAASEHDSKLAHESMERMAEAETHLLQVMEELRTAHSSIAESLKDVRKEVRHLIHDIRGASEFVEQPFWKRMGSRRA